MKSKQKPRGNGKGGINKPGPSPETRTCEINRTPLWWDRGKDGEVWSTRLTPQRTEEGAGSWERPTENHSGPRTMAVLRGLGRPVPERPQSSWRKRQEARVQTSIKTEAGRTKIEGRGANSSINNTNLHQVKQKKTQHYGWEGNEVWQQQRSDKRRGRQSHLEGDATTKGRKEASRKHTEGQERPLCPLDPAPAAPCCQLIYTHDEPERNMEQEHRPGCWLGFHWT